DHPGEDVAANRHGEHLIGQLDVADFLIVEIADGQSHGAASPSGASFNGTSAAAASLRNAAGNGTPSGALRLTASLTSTQPFLAPGTEPLIISSPRSASATITSTLCVVTRSAPR